MSARVALEPDKRSAAVDEFKRAKLALARVIYLGALYDDGEITPREGEITEAATSANMHLHTIESILGLDNTEEGSAET